METGRVAVASLSSTMGSSFSVSFFAPVSLVFWLFLVQLLHEIEQYSSEPLFQHESGTDEGESDEGNHNSNAEYHVSPDELKQEAVCCLELDEVHNKL